MISSEKRQEKHATVSSIQSVILKKWKKKRNFEKQTGSSLDFSVFVC